MMKMEQAKRFALELWGARLFQFLNLCFLLYWLFSKAEISLVWPINLTPMSYLFWYDREFVRTLAILIVPIFLNIALWYPHKISYGYLRWVLTAEKYKATIILTMSLVIGVIMDMILRQGDYAKDCFGCAGIALFYLLCVKKMLKFVKEEKGKAYFWQQAEKEELEELIEREWKKFKVYARNVAIVVLGIILWVHFGICEIIKPPAELEVRYHRNAKDEEAGWHVEEKFVIVNPPLGWSRQCELVEKYDKEHPMDIQAAKAAVDKARKMSPKRERENQNIYYNRDFYEESAITPRDWDGKIEYYNPPSPYKRIVTIIWREGGEKRMF